MRFLFSQLKRYLPTMLLGLFALGVFCLPHLAFAQDTGLEGIRDAAGFGSEDDLTIIVAKLIRTALTFLGVISVVIVMYGGFVWMTAGGSAEKVDRAKRILINGVIGMVIILMSWAITTFIITALVGATGGGNGGGGGGGGGDDGGLGGGSSSRFEVTAHQPSGQVGIRNVLVQITFSRLLDTATVDSGSISITNTATGAVVDGTLSASGNKVTFKPAAACPDPNTDRFCFESNTEYTVTVDDSIDSSTGVSLSCNNGKCTNSFTTGDLVDVEDPTAELTLPDAGVGLSVDSFVAAQVHGTDDAGVAVADFAASDVVFDSVPASGADLTDVLINSLWDTTGLQVGQRYRVAATVSDLAGNTDEDSTTVVIRSATCFNGVQDGAETGLDCGGDPNAAEFCGACDGSACTENAQCSSGLCLNGSCTTSPVIEEVSPLDGAPGTFVTLQGKGFGSAIGTVTFTGAAGAVVATLPVCAAGWTNDEIVVQVPEGAVDGPIALTTAAGLLDTTDDTLGPVIVDFDVNTNERPGLCSLSPNVGRTDGGVTITGQNLGNDRDDSEVRFDTTASSSYSLWSDGQVGVTVPELSGGADDYDVTAVVNGVASNALRFRLLDDNTTSPVIASLDPAQGGVGQYVTVSGTGFGLQTGTVWFEHALSGRVALADVEFPAACANGIWNDDQVTIIVPEAFQNGDALELGDYTVYLINGGGVESNRVAFAVTGDDPTPGLCALDPDTALPGATVVLSGDNFGLTTGSTLFFQEQAAAVTGWSNSEVTVTVPNAATTGPVVVRDAAGNESNPLNFEVSGSDAPVAGANLAAYGWSFSSGVIPQTPEAIFTCSDEQISGVPNDDFTSGGVCVNADVYVEFTVDMNEASLNGNVHLEKCTAGGNNPCANVTEVPGTLTTTPRSALLTIDEDLDTSSVYQVRLDNDIVSLDNVPLGDEVDWSFTTRGDTTRCSVENVIVSPATASIDELFGTRQFQALPVAGCMVLRNDDFSYAWSIDQSYARFNTTAEPSCNAGTSSCANAEALAEGVTEVTARETDSGISDAGTLTINFSDPYVVNQWPNCEEACVNAEVGATFNTAMKRSSIEAAGSVILYRCANELCSTLTRVSGAAARCTEDATGRCIGFTFDALSLVPNTFYRVVIAGEVESTSGVPLIRTNFGGDYSWVFRVREDATACAVDRISVEPGDALVREIGGTQAFTATAFGSADSCSVSGQRLSGFDYEWDWIDPISDDDIDDNPVTHVADWLNDSLVDTDPRSVAEGCTSSCVSAGSQPYEAICGDGFLDATAGEECEDGNVSGGDGCSAACLREGGTAGSCGNGTVNRAASGAGEDCDDGNTVSGDGCSNTCLAEGSASVDATCGNSDIAVLTPVGRAGEECDDGNALRGDGCSAECLNEGSPTLASVGGAVCSNGVVEAPAEMCDDNNTANGDGCSDHCLLEGSSLSYGSVCGDGTVATGEACDDSNTRDGDGCSADCLPEGSSAEYGAPSFCGDGIVGTGERPACEVSAGGDGQIDPLQVAKIDDSAVFEVSTETRTATATIEVSEASSRLSTTANLQLSCTAQNDLDCSQPQTFGLGEGGCCVERPHGQLYPNGANVCRNATLYGIFDREMDLSSFTFEEDVAGAAVVKYRMYAQLDLASTGSPFCPADHMTLAGVPRSPLVRLWYQVRDLLGHPVQAASGDCVAPINDFSQIAREDGTFEVRMTIDALLVPDARYRLVVEGDRNIANGIPEGVRSSLGAGLNGNLSQVFTVGSEICALDDVTIRDTDRESPFLFTQANEAHVLVADAISHTSGVPQNISPVPGVYAWDFTSWSTEDNGTLFDIDQDTNNSDQARLAVQNDNGESVVIATATVTEDTAGVGGAQVVNGSAKIIAFLCENPWPSLTSVPWSDTARSIPDGAEQGAAFTNFSTMYCRDAGVDGFADDRPSVVVVRPPDSAASGVFKEYLFEVADGSGDAIGFRIVQNPDYLSPLAWYKSQGFVGEPREALVDSFQAIEDGRTTYVAAVNQAANRQVFSNIYVISYNEGASQSTREIYEELRSNLRFIINVRDLGLCVAQNGTTLVTDADGDVVDCSSDLDCGGTVGATCADNKGKLRRDSKRLGDITDIAALVTEYKTNNGVVPSLSAGSFVRGLSSSIWESWNTILGGALEVDSLPADPLNDYNACGTGTGFLANFDAETCVDENAGRYVCPADSYAYHYQAVGEIGARLYADLEYDAGRWVTPIETSLSDSVVIEIGNSASLANGFTTTPFCAGNAVFGASSSCGDGVVGGSEVCEIGQQGGTPSACTTSGGLPGNRSQRCNNTCSGFVNDPTATCTTATCGDGVINGGEECDDAGNNGVYGFCGQDCTYDTAFFCGDGLLAGGEACDCGVPGLNLPNSRAYQAGPGSCGGANGDYNANPNATCAADCAGPAAFCGDTTVDGNEVCDGANETWNGKLCAGNAGPAFRNQPCTANADCGGAACGGTGGGNRAACPVGTTRVKTCDDTAGATCSYPQNNWFNIACTEIGSCGDGVIDPDEQCDDGNTDSTDSCTASCTLNVCGDGAVFLGEEQCDEGAENGQSCSAAFGSSCTACSLSCRYEVATGEFCGDGVRNGNEYCDGSDIPFMFFDAVTDKLSGTCDTLGQTKTVTGVGYTCRNVGICNGGTAPGQFCTNNTGGADQQGCPGGGSCVLQSCNDSCLSSCPFTTTSESLLVTANQPGSRPEAGAGVFSFLDSTTAQLPNAASITVPACSVATSFSANISLANVEPPTTYVVFLTDESFTMKYEVSNDTTPETGERTRLQVAVDSMEVAFDDLFDGLDQHVEIASIGFKGLVRNECFISTNACTTDANCSAVTPGDFCNDSTSSLQTGIPYGDLFDFVDEGGKSSLLAEVGGYFPDVKHAGFTGHGTFTYEALEEALDLFEEVGGRQGNANARYIGILLSDGEVPVNAFDPAIAADKFDDFGYELYTAVFSTNPEFISNMEDWSSNESGRSSGANGLDYSYVASTEAQLAGMYEQIIESILSINVTLTTSDGGTPTQTSANVIEGANVSLPFPEGFVCDPAAEQQVPLQFAFPGVGQLEVSNVRMNACLP